ncbi:response regulator transcription factor [uncultured Draconibacterium sp.]|uniref:response regulator transcription factor n=1 Tax=uncultured Draconibacterium sp. TaxID=1573823 RepID=UPI003216AAB7
MKVLIADDHSIVREGLKQILKEVISNAVIDEATNGDDALEFIKKQEYDFVIMDISMPGKSGLDVLNIIKEREIVSKILVLTMHPQEQYAIRALKLGASGYLCKSSLYEELAIAIKTILSGKRYISTSLAESILFDSLEDRNKSPHEKLSERQFQIMRMLANGKSVSEIASQLFISDKTVRTHRIRILEKMNLKNNAELIVYALKNNLIE